MQYVFSGLLTSRRNGYSLYVPDIDQTFVSMSLFEVIHKARRYLAMLAHGSYLPQPSKPADAIAMAVSAGKFVEDEPTDRDGDRLGLEHIYIDLDTYEEKC